MYRKQSIVYRLLVAAVLMFGLGAQAAAQELDINLSNDSALFRYIGHQSGGSTFGGTETDLGFLYTTDDDIVGMFGIQVKGETGSGSPGLDAGVGLKAFGATAGDDDLFALTLGGQLRYRPQGLSRLVFGVDGFFSPDIVTFIDAESFSYVSARVGYEILPQATAYLGYRKIRADIEGGGKFTIESGGHVGVRLVF